MVKDLGDPRGGIVGPARLDAAGKGELGAAACRVVGHRDCLPVLLDAGKPRCGVVFVSLRGHEARPDTDRLRPPQSAGRK